MILVESWAPLVYDHCNPHNILIAVAYWATPSVQHWQWVKQFDISAGKYIYIYYKCIINGILYQYSTM